MPGKEMVGCWCDVRQGEPKTAEATAVWQKLGAVLQLISQRAAEPQIAHSPSQQEPELLALLPTLPRGKPLPSFKPFAIYLVLP